MIYKKISVCYSYIVEYSLLSSHEFFVNLFWNFLIIFFDISQMHFPFWPLRSKLSCWTSACSYFLETTMYIFLGLNLLLKNMKIPLIRYMLPISCNESEHLVYYCRLIVFVNCIIVFGSMSSKLQDESTKKAQIYKRWKLLSNFIKINSHISVMNNKHVRMPNSMK